VEPVQEQVVGRSTFYLHFRGKDVRAVQDFLKVMDSYFFSRMSDISAWSSSFCVLCTRRSGIFWLRSLSHGPYRTNRASLFRNVQIALRRSSKAEREHCTLLGERLSISWMTILRRST
jgi:hypothetical protein